MTNRVDHRAAQDLVSMLYTVSMTTELQSFKGFGKGHLRQGRRGGRIDFTHSDVTRY